MEQIICKDVSLGYDGNIVSEGISFRVCEGDYLCIVGENGAGKSTLMKALLGLHKPMSGTIALAGGLRQDEIGYLPQQTSYQKDFPASVEEVVVSGCLSRSGLRPFYNRREKQYAKENMQRLGILPLCKRCYRELSGGQQQRVLLARALCSAGKLLVLDEPVSGLDPAATNDMYEIIRKLNREDGVTIIMISHDIAAAAREADHILHLSRHPLYFGETRGYLASCVGEAFLRTEVKADER
ncbi:MAG: ABC transporter ATP-binding protein [Clostridia bacterium]|nr:ABC transporter ATP-binding protein [Clostridia bacterium]